MATRIIFSIKFSKSFLSSVFKTKMLSYTTPMTNKCLLFSLYLALEMNLVFFLVNYQKLFGVGLMLKWYRYLNHVRSEDIFNWNHVTLSALLKCRIQVYKFMWYEPDILWVRLLGTL